MNFDEICKKKVILGEKNNAITIFTQITTLYIDIEK